MKLHVLPAGMIQTNAYLLTEVGGAAVLIDAPGDVWAQVAPILSAERCMLHELWITHGHWDHIQGGAEVVRASGAKVRAHRADQAMIETPEVMERFMGMKLALEPVRVDHWVKQGQRFRAFGHHVEVRHVPGHCPGNVLFLFADARPDGVEGPGGMAFVGDALFNSSVGRTDLPGGDFPTLEESIRNQIYSLPDVTLIYPGHGPETTVGQEKKHNPYVHG